MADAKTEFNALFDDFLGSEFFGTAAKTCTLTITSGGTIDPITGDVTGGSDTVYTADGFMRDIRDKEFRDVQGGDMVFTVKQDDLAYTPVDQDEVVISGGSTFDGTYHVVELKADGADVAYRIQLRR